MNARLPLALLVAIWSGAALLVARTAGGAEPAAIDQAFVQDYCTNCHNGVSKKGRLDLASLTFEAKDPANLAVWIKVHDRLQAGEMPPSSRARPDAARQKAFLQSVSQSIIAAEQAALAGEGRSVLRRFNRQEYEPIARRWRGSPL